MEGKVKLTREEKKEKRLQKKIAKKEARLRKKKEKEIRKANKPVKDKLFIRILKDFNWGYYKICKNILGIFIFSAAINLFIVPNNLYSGGTLGMSQLIRTAIVNVFGLHLKFDLSSIIYYIINIPLLVLAYRKLSKTFFVRTILTVTLNSFFLFIIPIPSAPLTEDLLANVLIGGILAGIGVGMVLSTGSSTGGTDIIGMVLTQKSNKITVGAIGLGINVIIYLICGFNYGIEIMIYSIIYAIFETIMIDRTHSQVIFSEAIIFTKEPPQKMIHFINYELNRGATYWEAIGGYTETKTYIVYAVLSKYERMRLERHMHEFDEKAFMVGYDGMIVKGEFSKYLV